MGKKEIFVIICFHAVLSTASRPPVINDGNSNKPIDHVPYVASLRFNEEDEGMFGKGHFCTGVFIASKSVLTLASCFYQNDALVAPEDIRVIGGTKYRYEEEQNTFSSLLEEIIIHENFSRSSLENNVAIGILLTKLPSDNSYVFPINGIALESPAEDQKLKIYGWELSVMLGESQNLLEGDVVVMPLDQCDSQFSKITSTTICAGPYHVNGCESDDGAPLVEIFSGVALLYGLIDVRPPGYCRQIITNRLGTYVDVSKFYEWIQEHKSSSKCATLSYFLISFSMIITFSLNI